MLQYLVKRLLLMIPTLIGIMVVSFLIVKLAPGDPSSQKFGGGGEQAGAGMDVERGTQQAEKRYRERYHLDEPLHVQFGHFLYRFGTLNLISFQQEKPIRDELLEHLKVTILLNLIVFSLIYMVAIPAGIWSATYQNSGLEALLKVFLFLLASLPSFWVAELLRMWLANKTQIIWFPMMNLSSEGADKLPLFQQWLDWLHHAALPVTCMTYGAFAYLSRQMRVGMLEVIRQDYIRTAEAKGCSKARVILVHALRNGIFPVITLLANLLPFLVGGTVIIETIFNIPGMGLYAFEAMLRREYDIVMGTLILSAVLTLFGILLSDILYVLVNPRVSFEETRK